MTIPFAFNRLKSSTTNVFNGTLNADNPTFGSSTIDIRVYLDNLDIDNQVIAADPGITWAGTLITGIQGSFDNVRAGDVISSSTGFVSSQTVLSVDLTTTPSAPTITTSAAADVDTGNEELTFTPPNIDSTVYVLRLTNSVAGNTLRITPTIGIFDGNNAEEGSSADNSDNLTYDDATSIQTFSSSDINLDSFLSNARVARLI